jgi:hypothetical protein
MQTLKRLYRSDYAGENVITNLTLVDGDWDPDAEYVPSQVSNTYTTSQAVAIGNGESRQAFDLIHIEQHKGGLLAANKLQSYGCNAVYRDATVDFLIVTSDVIAHEVAASGYADSNIVYSNADSVLKYPGKFYLTPQNMYLDAGALAAYMACFDGHKKVFLIGYDQYETPTKINNIYKDTNGYLSSDQTDNGEFFARSLSSVVQTYSDVEFVRVMPFANQWAHSSLTPLANFRQINYRDFVIEADIG